MKIRVLQMFHIGDRQYLPDRQPLPGGGFAPQYEEIENDDMALWCCSQGWCEPAPKEPAPKKADTPKATIAGRSARSTNPEEGTE